MDKIKSVVAGRMHNFLILENGELMAWGVNRSGQLGDGTNIGRKGPAKVRGLESEVLQVVGGSNHSLALLKDGRVMGWGDDHYGQLGFRGWEDQLIPREMEELRGRVETICAGAQHSLVLLKDGTVFGWGDASVGQLGTRRPPSRKIFATKEEVKNLATGFFFNLLLLKDGTVAAMGQNSDGQLGNGELKDSPIPVRVRGLKKRVIQIAGGAAHSLALLEDGEVLTWGSNREGLMGTGSTYETIPIRVKGLKGKAVAIKAGTHHSLVLLEDGRVMGWGNNRQGQLGLKGVQQRAVPVVVTKEAALAKRLFGQRGGLAIGIRELEIGERVLAQEEIAI